MHNLKLLKTISSFSTSSLGEDILYVCRKRTLLLPAQRSYRVYIGFWFVVRTWCDKNSEMHLLLASINDEITLINRALYWDVYSVNHKVQLKVYIRSQGALFFKIRRCQSLYSKAVTTQEWRLKHLKTLMLINNLNESKRWTYMHKKYTSHETETLAISNFVIKLWICCQNVEQTDLPWAKSRYEVSVCRERV